MRDDMKLLVYLARSELQRRHAGSFGGAAWTLMSPIVLVGAMWFALDTGLGMRAVAGPGFGIALVVAMIAWLPFADSVSDATTSVVRNPHLVKKMVFPIVLMPLATVLAAFAVHIILLCVLMAALALLGHLDLTKVWTLPLWMLQSTVLTAGIALIASSLNVSIRDTQAITSVLTAICFWLTPVVWSLRLIDPSYHWLIGLNPMAVVVEGYRMALTGAPFPFDLASTGASMLISLLFGAVGGWLFAALRPSFADSI